MRAAESPWHEVRAVLSVAHGVRRQREDVECEAACMQEHATQKGWTQTANQSERAARGRGGEA